MMDFGGGAKEKSAEPYKDVCVKKAAECKALCKGVIKEQTCSVTTGVSSCQCGMRGSGGGAKTGRRRAAKSVEPYVDLCKKKAAGCQAECKGVIKEEACSAKTG